MHVVSPVKIISTAFRAQIDLQFDVVIVGGDLDDAAAGKRGGESVVDAHHLLEIVAVANQQLPAAERHRLPPDDRRPGPPRHWPVVRRTQLFRVRLYTVYIRRRRL